MRARLINKFSENDDSFSLQSHIYKNFLNAWHYHPELELVVILESSGTRFVGDSIEKFEPGEVVLLGKNLPHLWLNDKVYFSDSTELFAKAHVIHFHENFAGSLFDIPEMAGISQLLEHSKRGIRFELEDNKRISGLVNEMFNHSGVKRVIDLLEILDAMSQAKAYKYLASTSYVNTFSEIQNAKIVRIFNYIMHNFKNEISLESAAELANMNPSSFSRYFKNLHKKTFVQYLNEVRINYACKLLIEDNLSIANVCYESGFNNISNFNRQFKNLKKVAPSEFIKHYVQR